MSRGGCGLRRGTALLLLSLLLPLSACLKSDPALDGEKDRPFEFADLARNDIDLMVEISQGEVLELLRQLAKKLYLRNPNQLRRGGGYEAEESVARIFAGNHNWRFPELDRKRGVAALKLAFDQDFSGDRVLALSVGLGSMVMASYDFKTRFYYWDRLKPQKLYNAARNVEIAVWRLRTERDERGELLLLTNSRTGEPENLSFERLFGKVIAYQDYMAKVAAKKTRRTLRTTIQFLASKVFLPI